MPTLSSLIGTTIGQDLSQDQDYNGFKAVNFQSEGIVDNASATSVTVNADGSVSMSFDASVAGDFSLSGAVAEQQYNLTGTVIDPSNGTLQYVTLAGNVTYTETIADGEFVTLLIDDGTGFTVTWPTITWVGGAAPTLGADGYNVVHLFQVNTVLYGVYLGAAF